MGYAEHKGICALHCKTLSQFNKRKRLKYEQLQEIQLLTNRITFKMSFKTSTVFFLNYSFCMYECFTCMFSLEHSGTLVPTELKGEQQTS